MKQFSKISLVAAAVLGASLYGSTAQALDKNFKLNGFMRVGTIQTNAESELADFNSEGGRNYPNVDSLTTVGLQGTYAMSPKDDFVIQIVGRGIEKFDTGLEWAYVSHKFNRNWSGTVGRLRTPFFMLSESQEVGFSYPMVYLPNEMYRLFGTTTDGVNTKYRFFFGDWYGETKLSVSTIENKAGQYGSTLGFSVSQGRSLSFTFGTETLTLYMSVLRGRFTVDVPEGSTLATLDDIFETYGARDASFGDDFRSNYNDFGLSWDPGDWYVLGEVGQLSFSGGFLDDKISGYMLVGRRIGKLMPYVMYTKGYTQSDGDQRRREALQALGNYVHNLGAGGLLTNDPPICPAKPGDSSGISTLDSAISRVCSYQQKQTTYSLGLRYDISNRLAGKFQLSYATDLDGTYGTFYYPLGRDNATIVAFSLDGVF